MKKLNFKTYLGGGHAHYFKNNETGELVCVQSTAQEYAKLGEKEGGKYNPTLPGHTWLYSANGSIRVDTPSQLLKDGEYTTINGEHVVGVDTKKAGIGIEYKKIPLDAVTDKQEVDETIWQ